MFIIWDEWRKIFYIEISYKNNKIIQTWLKEPIKLIEETKYNNDKYKITLENKWNDIYYSKTLHYGYCCAYLWYNDENNYKYIFIVSIDDNDKIFKPYDIK